MKKIITSILMLTMLVTLLSGCSLKERLDKGTSGNKDNVESPKETSKPNDPEQTEKPEEIAGTEITTFMTNYTDIKSKIWDELTKKIEADGNLAFSMGTLYIAFADLAIVDILLFDALTVKDGDTYKGQLMFSGIEAWKKVKGDKIEFGYDYTYQEDNGQNKKGDRQVAQGSLDQKAGELLYERYTESNGVKSNRLVVQIIRNSDKSYSSQIYSFDAEEGQTEGALNGYFTWFEGTDIITIAAEKENETVDFSFNNISGKKNVRPEEMASGMKILSTTSYIGGEASYVESKE